MSHAEAAPPGPAWVVVVGDDLLQPMLVAIATFGPRATVFGSGFWKVVDPEPGPREHEMFDIGRGDQYQFVDAVRRVGIQ